MFAWTSTCAAGQGKLVVELFTLTRKQLMHPELAGICELLIVDDVVTIATASFSHPSEFRVACARSTNCMIMLVFRKTILIIRNRTCYIPIVTHTEYSRVGRVFSGVYMFICLFVCLFVCFTAQYLKNRCSSDNQIWHTECSTMNPGNPFILGPKGETSRSRGTKSITGVVLALLWVLALSNSICIHFYTLAIKLDCNRKLTQWIIAKVIA